MLGVLTGTQEFQIFVKQTEQELWNLFESIDRDGNGKLDKDELMAAFKNAGLSVSESKLQRFMDEVDSNHDGSVDFTEWRFVAFTLPFNSIPVTRAKFRHSLHLKKHNRLEPQLLKALK